MSTNRRRLSKHKKDEQSSLGHPQLKSKRARNSDSGRDISGLPPNLLEAGNTAVAQLLSGMSNGRPLGPSVQAEMEQAFGTDFGDVRIHDDAAAGATAGELTAEAFTHGDDIYLADGPSTSTSAEGKRLLAHELAHVVQQRRAGKRQSRAVSAPGDRFEADADQAAALAGAGQPVRVTATGAPPSVQRQPAEQSIGEKGLDFILKQGISLTDEGWKIGGIPIEKVPPAVKTSAKIMSKILQGDLTGALEVVNPKDPEEEKRAWEKILRIKEEIDGLRPAEEREREKHEERHREAELVPKAARESAKNLGLRPPDPKFKLQVPELKLSEDLLAGPITHWMFDGFDLEKSQLKTKHRRKLNELADQVMSDPDAELEIVGHTDSSGQETFNKKLSHDRANAVRDYLIKRGVRADKIKSVSGKGAAEPFVTETTDADRAQNRRVEIFYKTGVVEKKRRGFGLQQLRMNR